MIRSTPGRVKRISTRACSLAPLPSRTPACAYTSSVFSRMTKKRTSRTLLSFSGQSRSSYRTIGRRFTKRSSRRRMPMSTSRSISPRGARGSPSAPRRIASKRRSPSIISGVTRSPFSR